MIEKYKALEAENERFKALNVELTAKCNWYNSDGARLERERDELKRQLAEANLHPPAPSAPEGNDLSDLPAKAADEIDRLLELVGVLMHALHRVKYRACGEKHPHWSDSQSIFVSRGFIADVCDMALLKAEGK